MVVINFQNQLQAGPFEHALHYLVTEKLDLSIFDKAFKNDKEGRPAYDPAILLKIILFAYSKGIPSSREIQWCCDPNIIFKALSCDSVPHFTTIASFISGYPEQIERLFEQILMICDEQGLFGHELFALDGCKLPSDAAKTWSGTHKELTHKRDKLKKLIKHHMAEHQKLDQEDRDEAKQARRTQQSIDTLNKAADKIEDFLENNEPRIGQGKTKKEVKSNLTDNESAKMTTSKGTIQGYNGVATVDKKYQIVIDAEAFGAGPEQPTLQPILKTIKERYNRLKINDDIFETDIIVTADTGFADEANMKYLHTEDINAYIPDNQFRSRDPKFDKQKEKYKRPSRAKAGSKPTFPAKEFTFDPIDQTCECPAGKQLSKESKEIDKNGNKKVFFKGKLTDCRDCDLKNKCLRNPAAVEKANGHGRQVSFILEKSGTPYTDWMKTRIDCKTGKQISAIECPW